MKKVSIIVPFYNSAKYIENCVLNIVNQTYPNIEAILVNDGSTDNSLEMLMDYTKIYPQIKVIDKEHSGVSETRNRGLIESSGEFVYFLDSDDTIEPDLVETLVNLLEETNADIAVCNFTHPSLRNYLGDCVLDMKKKADLIKYCQSTFAVVVPWNKIFRRSTITELFDKNVKMGEDDLFSLLNLKNVNKIVSTSKVLYHYYIPQSINSNEQSTISKIANDITGNTKKSYWYLRRNLLAQTLDSFNQYLDKETAEDCAYARIFDFMIWEMLLLMQLGVDLESITKEIKNVFTEPDFLYSLKIREKYGLKLKDMDDEELSNRVEYYVVASHEFYKHSVNDESFKAFYACLYLLIKEFLEPCGDISNDDLISQGYIDLSRNNTKETNIVNNIN